MNDELAKSLLALKVYKLEEGSPPFSSSTPVVIPEGYSRFDDAESFASIPSPTTFQESSIPSGDFIDPSSLAHIFSCPPTNDNVSLEDSRLQLFSPPNSQYLHDPTGERELDFVFRDAQFSINGESFINDSSSPDAIASSAPILPPRRTHEYCADNRTLSFWPFSRSLRRQSLVEVS